MGKTLEFVVAWNEHGCFEVEAVHPEWVTRKERLDTVRRRVGGLAVEHAVVQIEVELPVANVTVTRGRVVDGE